MATAREDVEDRALAAPSADWAVGWRRVLTRPATAVAVIWSTAALMSIFAPDMVTGSEQEHLPITAMTVWLWASLATAYTLMGARRTVAAPALVGGVSAIWIAVCVAVIATPVMETGTDPTTIPIAALIVPVVGAITTGFLALHQATASPTA